MPSPDRSTPQRTAIRAVVDAAERPLTAQEVLALAQQRVPGLGLATVYRSLRALTDAAALRVVQLPGDTPRYERAEPGHHHHFQCRSCGRVFDVHACPGNLAKLAPPGFAVDDHEITLYGRCADCTGGADKPRSPGRPRR